MNINYLKVGRVCVCVLGWGRGVKGEYPTPSVQTTRDDLRTWQTVVAVVAGQSASCSIIGLSLYKGTSLISHRPQNPLPGNVSMCVFAHICGRIL